MAEPKPTKPDNDDSADFVAGVQEGLASLDKGRSIPYEKIRRWLLSWGTDKELPPPE
jgi:predicted transcriptional regulator